ncbi:protein of unknown function [Caballeronia sp. S22]
MTCLRCSGRARRRVSPVVARMCRSGFGRIVVRALQIIQYVIVMLR